MHRPTEPAFGRSKLPNVHRYRFPGPDDAPDTDGVDEAAFALDYFMAFASLTTLVVLFSVSVAVPILGRLMSTP